MDFDATYIILSIVISTFGLIYFNYGRKQHKYAVVLCGLVLMIFPYFITNWIWMCVIAAVLLAVPKFARF